MYELFFNHFTNKIKQKSESLKSNLTKNLNLFKKLIVTFYPRLHS